MPQAERHADGAPGVAGRRLNPHLLERSFPQDAAVADAVERNAAGQAQVAQTGLAMREAGHLQHHLLGDHLDRPRDVHFALRHPRLGLARGPAEQPLELRPGHRQAVGVGEVLLVHPQAAVVTDVDEVILDGLDVPGFAVRRESHQLVFARVHLEAGEVGERGIQESKRVRKPQFAEDVELVAAADADRRGGPFADAVDRHHRRFFERRRIERRRRVRLVMFAEQDLAGVALEMAGDLVRQPQLAAKPQRHRHDVGAQAARRGSDVGLQQPLELQQRLFIKTDEIELPGGNASLAQAIRHRVRGKRRIVLLAGEALFLRRGHDASILDQTCR